MSTRNTARSPCSGASSSSDSRIFCRCTTPARGCVRRPGCAAAGLGRLRKADAERAIARELVGQPRRERLPIDALGRRPADFRDRGRAREDHVLGAILGADVLGPQVAPARRGCARAALRSARPAQDRSGRRPRCSRRDRARADAPYPADDCRSTASAPATARRHDPPLAAATAPSMPRHDITVAFGARPPSRISSQPISRRPCALRYFSIRCTK